MVSSVRDEWQSSLQVIRVTNEDELAVVDTADFAEIAFKIQPDALFLFRKTTKLNVLISNPTVTSSAVDASVAINISPDPLAIIHAMPDLRDLVLWLDESVKRVDQFTPSLPELKKITINLDKAVEFNPTAFDLQPCLKRLYKSRNEEKELLDKFETGLVAARFRECDCSKLLKLNSAAVTNIKEIRMSTGMVESIHPYSGLETLIISSNDFIGQGQLSFLPSLNNLVVYYNDAEGIYFND
jgi:hypothetical protein